MDREDFFDNVQLNTLEKVTLQVNGKEGKDLYDVILEALELSLKLHVKVFVSHDGRGYIIYPNSVVDYILQSPVNKRTSYERLS